MTSSREAPGDSVAILGSSLYVVRSSVAAPLPCPRCPVIPLNRVLIAALSLAGFAIIVSLRTDCRSSSGLTGNSPRYAPSAITHGICAISAALSKFWKPASSKVATPTCLTTISSWRSRSKLPQTLRFNQEEQLAAQRGAQAPRPPGRTPALAARGRYGCAMGA